MISSIRSSVSSGLSSAGQDGKKKLGKSKIDELMRSIKADLKLQSRLSKFYYTKVGEGFGMNLNTVTGHIGKGKTDIKKIQKIVEKENGAFQFDTISNKLTWNGSIVLDEALVKNHQKYSELRIDNISSIIRNASSKSAQMNSGDKLTDSGLAFINAALFDENTAITDVEVSNFLFNSGFNQEAVDVGLQRWYDLKVAINSNLTTDWDGSFGTNSLNNMLNGVMTSTFLQGLIHLYKNIRLQKTDNGKYVMDSVFGLLGSSFQAVSDKRQLKLNEISDSVGGTQENLNLLFQYADEFNRPVLTEFQQSEVNRQPNKTKIKDLTTKYKKDLRESVLRNVRDTFKSYATVDDKKLGSFLKSLDNFPVEGQFNNNTLLSISRSMVNSSLTDPNLKPVTGDEHNIRKEVLKQSVANVDSSIRQSGGNDVLLKEAQNLIQAGYYAVAIKLINYYINVKYKLFKSLSDEYLPKKVSRKKVDQTSMSIVLSE